MVGNRSIFGREYNPGVSGLLLVVVFLFLIGAGLYQMQPPVAVPSEAPPDVFSSGRAMAHLERIAAAPHPVGSAAHADVRDYLVRELTALGLNTQIQSADVATQFSNAVVRAASVDNIVARMPGTIGTGTILLMSHYDSYPSSFGAGDAGAGVAAILETIRALKVQSPLKNDLIVLLTDGEELWLLGVKAFMEQHPWVGDIDLVLNLEGRGTGGPAIMFETGKNNARLIDAFAAVAPWPVATSLSDEIYERLPNDTDFTYFKNAGYPGLNIAHIDRIYDYHTPNDNTDNLDERTLQHHGTQTLALVRHFGDQDLSQPFEGDAVYFSIGGIVISYGESWVMPQIVFVSLCLIGVLVFGYLRKRLTVVGLLLGFVAFLINLVLAPGILTGLTRILLDAYPEFPETDRLLLVYREKWFFVGFSFLTVSISAGWYVLLFRGVRLWQMAGTALGTLLLLYFAGYLGSITFVITLIICAALYFLFRRPRDVWDLALGGFFGWGVLTAVIGTILPGASYLLIWPLLCALIPPAYFFFSQERSLYQGRNLAILGVCAAPAVLMFSGILYLVLLAMGLPLVGGLMALIVLPAALLVPQFRIMTAAKPWLLPGAAGAMGIIIVAWGMIDTGFDARHPKPDTLFYAHNTDTGVSFWGSLDRQADEWNAPFLSDTPDSGSLAEVFPHADDAMLKHPAPIVSFIKPTVTMLNYEARNNIRVLHLLIQTGHNTPVLDISVNTAPDFEHARINGLDVQKLGQLRTPSGPWWRLQYFNVPEEGIQLTLYHRSSEPVEMHLADMSFGFPDLPDLEVPLRPAHLMPYRPFLKDVTDRTIVTRSFRF